MTAIINNYKKTRQTFQEKLSEIILEKSEEYMGFKLPTIEETRNFRPHRRIIYNRSKIKIPKNCLPLLLDENGYLDQSQFYKGAGI